MEKPPAALGAGAAAGGFLVARAHGGRRRETAQGGRVDPEVEDQAQGGDRQVQHEDDRGQS